MRLSIFLVFIAFLLGASVFGFYKSLELVGENEDLKLSMSELELRLDTSHRALKDARTSLGDVVKKNTGLEGEIAQLNKKLDQRSQEIQGYLQELALLSENFNQSVKANKDLMDRSDGLSKEMMKLQLENLEMKKRLSSATELKRAIAELRIREREERVRRIESQRRRQAPAERPEAEAPAAGGNAGYFMKDGRPTSEEKVDIRVIPVSEDPQGPPQPSEALRPEEGNGERI